MSDTVDELRFTTKFLRTLILCLTAFLLSQFISLYLSWPKQMVLGFVSIFLGITVNRMSASRVVTLALMIMSMTATLRYGWWRVKLLIDFFADASNKRFGIDSVFMLILIGAEGYTILIMVLGYIQTAWPLRRKPIPLPNDDGLWPHVDVLIPTYNEPLSLVRYTALAALNIDYPPAKLHVYILDDGSRADFAEFAEMAGVGYITRDEHKHAKAGNINHALTTMDSPFVTIFDCDHVPTRSFLQMTLGWMLVDPDLAMLQTPHHFYSPDPFERNLLQYKTIPSEAELFYGIVQDGNDFWNATFFCGSCALIRRSALDEVGGIAVETVTEDAHTSLRMQKLGYNTAYINIPQAAGLATESLAAHVGQRIRWARGMIQIFRTDNPLLAGGMKFVQRLCYLNAMIHFLYAVPRLVFLCAPLVYMLLGRTIIPGYWVAILAYAIPHLILSSLTNSRIQGRHRHSFWNEIYESVLAPYILAPTLLALINPKLGKFNVTDKGSTLNDTRFDGRIATPTKWLLLLNFLGLLAAPYRMFVMDPQHKGTVIMNLVWILFNMVILGVAAAVALEQKQRRGSVRIEARIPVRLDLPSGRYIHAMSIDMSVGGASIKVPVNEHFGMGDTFRLAFPEHAGDATIGATVVGTNKGEVRLGFLVPTIAEQEILTRALYSRADAWLTSVESKEVDRPLKSLYRVVRLSFYGFYQIVKSLLPQKAPAKPRALPRVAAIVLLTLLGGSSRMPGSTLRAGSGQAATGEAAAPAPDDALSMIQQTLSLKDMGVAQTIEMRGPHSYYSVRFTLPNALVPRNATLKLRYIFDPSLDPGTTSLRISLNGTAITTLSPKPGAKPVDGFVDANIPVPEGQLIRSNIITFEFMGSGVMEREAQAQTTVLERISRDSTLEVSGDRLRLATDLSQLPLPFLDSDLQTTTIVPFAFITPPSAKMLQAAGIVASWLGLQAGSKPVRFAASVGDIPMGNVVLFADHRSTLPVTPQLPDGTGPVVALRDNPGDPYGSVLIVAGDDEDQLLSAARTLSLTKAATIVSPAEGIPLSGDTATIPDLVMPVPRKEGDAPRWLPVSSAARLASCSSQGRLQTDDSTVIPVYFHLPPDLFYGERQTITMHLHYRYNALAVKVGSALRIVLNGVLVNEVALAPGAGLTERERIILVPVVALRPFGNTMLFNFDFVSAKRDAEAESLKGEILCSSSLDLHGIARWTQMPNLGIFANAGFPFTQLPDLSETTVILPTVPNTSEIDLYLNLMGHFGAQTGYPALRVTVAGPNVVISGTQDYLILGSVANQPAFNSLDASLPVTLDSNGLHVKQTQSDLSAIEDTLSRRWSKLLGNPEMEALAPEEGVTPDALIEEIQSPYSPNRSFILVALRENASSEEWSKAFLERSQSGDITGSVSLLRRGQFESYPLGGATYHVGDISWFALMRIYLARYFILLLLVVTALSFVIALWTREWLSNHARERLKPAEMAEAAN